MGVQRKTLIFNGQEACQGHGLLDLFLRKTPIARRAVDSASASGGSVRWPMAPM